MFIKPSNVDANQRTVFAPHCSHQPNFSQPHPPDFRRRFLGYGPGQDFFRIHNGTIRGLTVPLRSRLDLTWWVVSIQIAERGMRDDDG